MRSQGRLQVWTVESNRIRRGRTSARPVGAVVAAVQTPAPGRSVCGSRLPNPPSPSRRRANAHATSPLRFGPGPRAINAFAMPDLFLRLLKGACSRGTESAVGSTGSDPRRHAGNPLFRRFMVALRSNWFPGDIGRKTPRAARRRTIFGARWGGGSLAPGPAWDIALHVRQQAKNREDRATASRLPRVIRAVTWPNKRWPPGRWPRTGKGGEATATRARNLQTFPVKAGTA